MQRVEPAATGGPIVIHGSADTIMTAFAHAGIWAVLSITVLLWIALRRVGDVLRTLVPLLVSAVVTLEMCVAFGIALNFANVIALPLLLGIGVAFKIYYVIAWRAGKTHLLQSSLTHAVLFSAATTATAFGSLWLSSHRHVQHGQAAGAGAGLHAGGRGVLPADADGPPAPARRRPPRHGPGGPGGRQRPARQAPPQTQEQGQDLLAGALSRHEPKTRAMRRTFPLLRPHPLPVLAATALLCAGCASGPQASPDDPLEPLNRAVSRSTTRSTPMWPSLSPRATRR